MELGDGTTKIFLNCASDQWGEYPALKPFADYVMGKNDTDDSFIQELDKAVRLARQNAQWRKEYMNLQEKMYLSKKEGREEERLNGIYNAYTLAMSLTSKDIALKKTAELYNISEEEIKEVISGHEEKVKDPD